MVDGRLELDAGSREPDVWAECSVAKEKKCKKNIARLGIRRVVRKLPCGCFAFGDVTFVGSRWKITVSSRNRTQNVSTIEAGHKGTSTSPLDRQN
jgi:hypothetical protein